MLNTHAPLLTVFIGAFSLLGIFSLIGFALGLRAQASGGEGSVLSTVKNLNARIKAWWLILFMLALAFWIGTLGLTLLFGFVSWQCLREFFSYTQNRTNSWPTDHTSHIWCFAFFLPLQYFAISIYRSELFWILIPVGSLIIIPIVIALGQNSKDYLSRVASIQWGLLCCVFCLSHVPALLLLEIPHYQGQNALLVAFLILIAQSSDVFQYVWGKFLGKHKLAPQISPSKTLEGLLGGILTSTALGTALWWITPFSPWQAALLALTINITGALGGLVLSAIKRERGIKDWGSLIDGHGGMLDRVDSLIFSAPVFYYLVRYGWSA